MPRFTVEKLEKMYESGKAVDRELFAEMRTNILLKSGKHYNKKAGRVIEELRSRGVISDKQKIRLTKNHMHRICNEYDNAVLEGDPSSTAVPFNPDELQDVKQAEQANGIISWVKETNNWSKKRAKLVGDFHCIGEVFGKVRYDYDKGKSIGKDEEGNPVRLGEFVVDRVFGFDCKRDPSARDWDEVRWLIQEQMVKREDFLKVVQSSELAKEQKEKLANLEGSKGKQVIKVFDGNSGSYREVKNEIFVRELYFKPSPKYPNGFFVMWAEDIIVFEEELPFGIWPWVVEGFDELTTSPRSSSILRVARPYQVEINRAASKMAEHQITLGDDKVYIQKGTKISSGGYVHGVRAVQVAGKEPVIQSGRSGAQYLDYMKDQIVEMYEAVNLAHVIQDKDSSGGDPYLKLFEAMKHKKKFVKYVEKWERFEIAVFQKVLEMARHYLTAQHAIRILGSSEIVNVEEFKEIEKTGYEIKVQAQSGDVETKFGKILSTTAVLQYAGSSLKPDQLGSLIRNLPFGNDEQAFSTLTINEDNAKNTILALDRGEEVRISLHDEHKFMIEALNHRMKKSDFRFLDPVIQQRYELQLRQHEILFEQQQIAAQRAQQGAIPAGGFLITANASWFNPVTNRVERIKIPSEALFWLVQQLNTQGFFAQQLGELPLSSQASIGARQDQPLLQERTQPQAAQPVPQALPQETINGG